MGNNNGNNKKSFCIDDSLNKYIILLLNGYTEPFLKHFYLSIRLTMVQEKKKEKKEKISYFS